MENGWKVKLQQISDICRSSSGSDQHLKPLLAPGNRKHAALQYQISQFQKLKKAVQSIVSAEGVQMSWLIEILNAATRYYKPWILIQQIRGFPSKLSHEPRTPAKRSQVGRDQEEDSDLQSPWAVKG